MVNYERVGGLLVKMRCGSLSERVVRKLLDREIIEGCVLTRRFRDDDATEYQEGGYRIVEEKGFECFFMDSSNI